MVTRIVLVGIAAALLSVLTHFYIGYRHSMYGAGHRANAFDVTLWRMTEPGEDLALHILPEWWTNHWGAEQEVLEHRARVFIALELTLNALIWGIVASTGALIFLRLKRRAGIMRALGYICISISGLFLLCAAGNCWFRRDGVAWSVTSGTLAWSRFWEAFRFALPVVVPILVFGLWCVFRRRRITDEPPTI
jgi:hypothetical protein